MVTKALLVAVAAGGLAVPAMHNWTADLTPMPGHKISGTATFDGDTKNAVKVSLTLENAQPNSTVRWHIHQGACSKTDAPIVGKDDAYTAAQTDGSGRVNTTASLPINLNVGGYSIRVHETVDPTKTTSDPYKSQDSTARKDTTVTRDTTYKRDTTMQSSPSSSSSMASQPKSGDDLAACGDLKPQGGEKANRQ